MKMGFFFLCILARSSFRVDRRDNTIFLGGGGTQAGHPTYHRMIYPVSLVMTSKLPEFVITRGKGGVEIYTVTPRKLRYTELLNLTNLEKDVSHI